MTIRIAVLVVALSGALAGQAQTATYRHHGEVLLPDPVATPGIIRTTSAQEICAKGFTTKKYRHTTKAMKDQVYAAYGAKKKAGRCCEVDHLVPLELGAADDVRNLWPQPYEPRPGAHEKDWLENFLHRQVCAGKVDLPAAQREITEDWYAAYLKYHP